MSPPTGSKKGPPPAKKAPPAAKKAPPADPCVPCTLLKKCDGGTGIMAAATAANGGKAPTIKIGKPSSGFDAETDTTTGTITIKKMDPCSEVDKLIIELSNLSHKADFAKINSDVAAGKLSRDEYIKGNEKLEYDGVKTALKAFDKCSKTWGCKTSSFEWARSAKDFNDYFKSFLGNNHKEHYGKFWDSNYKPAYDKAHPPKKGP
jgi:hypothetical protein